MKLYIAFTGLMMILQPNDPGPVEILFLDGQGRTAEYLDNHYPLETHRLRVELDKFEATRERIYISDLVDMALDLDLGNQNVSIQRIAGFLRFSELYSKHSDCLPSLRRTCTGPMALQRCRNEDRPLLAGRFYLNGGTLEPVEVAGRAVVRDDHAALNTPTEEEEVRQAYREPWKACPMSDPRCTNPSVTQTTFNGALYSLDLGPYSLDLNAHTPFVTLLIGNHRLELPIREQTACSEVGGLAGERCAFVQISNSFEQDPHAPTSHDDDVIGIDLHFALNYDLFEPLPAECPMMMPVWDYYDSGKEPGGGTRCIPPLQP